MKNLLKTFCVAAIGMGLGAFTPGEQNHSSPEQLNTAVIVRDSRIGDTHTSYSSDTCEHIYDDGEWERAYYYLNEDDVMAEEFVTDAVCDFDTFYVDAMSIRLLSREDYPPFGWPDPGRDAFRIGVWVDENGDGFPDEPPVLLDTIPGMAKDGVWTRLHPHPLLCVPGGRHFWVGVMNLKGGGEEALCLDSDTDYPEYKWGREGGRWFNQDYYGGDHMIRVSMGGNRFPTLTGPTSVSTDEQNVLRFEVTAGDPDGGSVFISVEDLPSGALCLVADDRASFEWTPDFCQSGTYYPRFIARDIGEPPLSETLEVSVTVENVNRPPTIAAEPSLKWGSVGDPVKIQVSLLDPDWSECHDDTVYPTLTGPGVLIDHGDGTVSYRWVPEPDDTGSTMLSFKVLDSFGLGDSVDCEIVVFPHRLQLGLKEIYVYPGQQHVLLPIVLSNPTDSIGAFEIIIEYDITVFYLVDVTTPDSLHISPISPDSGWYYSPPGYPPEYFEVLHRPGGYPNRVQIVAILDMAWPSQTTPPVEPGADQLLFCLVGDVSSLWDGHIGLVGFRTLSCGTNTLASSDGYTVWGPTLEDAPRQICPGRPDSLRRIDLEWGRLGIYEILVGDLNLNGIPYEIGDALVFVNYYIYGISALLAPTIQGPNSDVNGDGIWWSIGDLVMLLNIIHEQPLCKHPPAEEGPVEIYLRADSGNELRMVVNSPVSLGAAFIHMEYDTTAVEMGIARIDDSGSDMTLVSNVCEDEVRILIYSMEGASIPAGESPLVAVSYRLIGSPSDDLNAHIWLKEVSCADKYGRDLTVWASEITTSVSGGDYLLRQNVPNPFWKETEIAFTVANEDEVTLTVYDSSGRLVKTLFEGVAAKGTYRVCWEGRDESGRPLPSGAYFCVMEGGGHQQVRKLMMLK